MASQPVRLGPFVGGLNNVSTAGESRDEEVVEMINYELALDTSLMSRPPLELLQSSRPFGEMNWEVYGIYRLTSSEWYVVAGKPSTSANEWAIGAYLNGDLESAPLAIKTVSVGNKITGFVQYNDWCYFLTAPGSSISCFRWRKSTAAADIATMPKGTSLVSWKDRLWVTGSQSATTGNYIWFSTVDATGAKPDTWNTTTDFINIDPGSGGLNTTLLPLTSTILIFKEDATYRFSFPNAPKNGEVISLSRQVGASGPTSAVAFENYSFVYDQGRIYELINTKFTQINLGVRFDLNAGISVDAVAPGVDLSIVGRRLIVRYFMSIYVYSIDTRTWAQWQSHSGTPGRFIELPADSDLATPVSFYAPLKGLEQAAGTNRVTDSIFADEALSELRTIADGNAVISIADGAVTLSSSSSGYMYLEKESMGIGELIPIGANQKIAVSVSVIDMVGLVTLKVRLVFKKLNGTEEVIEVSASPTEGSICTFPIVTAPIGAYATDFSIGIVGTGTGATSSIQFSSPTFILESSVRSAAGVFRFIDGYRNSLPKELITCIVKTKAFDYQAPAIFKRLFLWGVDIVTPRLIRLRAIPLGKSAAVTWDMAAAYTWDQLAQGTWNNPLSWKFQSKTITDVTGPFTDVSENGRYFIKAPKALRFRQIQFEVITTSLGNLETGPSKVFTLTTYTKAGQFVTDKAT